VMLRARVRVRLPRCSAHRVPLDSPRRAARYAARPPESPPPPLGVRSGTSRERRKRLLGEPAD
jgi:hypothetical protein